MSVIYKRYVVGLLIITRKVFEILDDNEKYLDIMD